MAIARVAVPVGSAGLNAGGGELSEYELASSIWTGAKMRTEVAFTLPRFFVGGDTGALQRRSPVGASA